MHRKVAGVAMAALMLATAAGVAQAGAKENRATAVAFIESIFVRNDVETAFSKYVGPRYVQHNPHVADGIDGAKKALGGMAANRPAGYKFEVIKAVADDNYAVVHSRSHADGKPDTSVIDWFKLEKGKIVEHWDAFQSVIDNPANGNTLFGK